MKCNLLMMTTKVTACYTFPVNETAFGILCAEYYGAQGGGLRPLPGAPPPTLIPVHNNYVTELIECNLGIMIESVVVSSPDGYAFATGTLKTLLVKTKLIIATEHAHNKNKLVKGGHNDT